MRITLAQIQRGILLLWALWFGVVLLTNLFDALHALGAVPAGWKFLSGNYALMGEVLKRYPVPAWVDAPLFLGVLLWQSLATALFARAAMAWAGGSEEGRARARNAFAVGLGLWGTFLVADELLIAYTLEGTHLGLLVAQMVSLFVVELLRDPAVAGATARKPARGAHAR
jgi:hypothetical protein